MQLFNYLFEGSLLLCLLYLVYFLFLKSSTFHQLNRWYLLGSLFLCAIMPLIGFPDEVVQQSFSYSLPVIEINGSSNNNIETTSVDWLHFFGLIYIFVVIGFVANLLFKYGLLYIIAKNICFNEFQNFNVCFGKKGSPAFSFFKYIFIPNVNDEKEKEVLLQHEMAHAKALHSFDILLVEFFKCVLWFHPVIYWFKNALVAQHEYAIDRQLTHTNFSVQQYGQFLINQTQMQPAYLGVTNFFNRSLIKSRIKMMTSKKSKKQIVLNYIITIVIVVGACVFTIACQQETPPLAGISNNIPLLLQNTAYLDEIKHDIPENISDKDVLEENELEDNTDFLQMENLHKPTIKKKVESSAKLMGKKKPATTLNLQKKSIKNENPQKIKAIDKEDDNVYEIVDEMPEFPGGDSALFEFLYGNLKYPEEARRDSIQGLAVVGFIVEKDGNITNFKVLRSIGGGTNHEIVGVINLMPKWIPGKENGENVRVNYALPVRFKLN